MKHEPMTQERLDAIRERVDASSAPWMPAKPDEVYRAEDGKQVAWNLDPEDVDLIAHAPDDLADLLAEVQRLKRFESIVSWRYGDTTDGRTREDMVERAKRAFGAATAQVSSIPLGMSEDMFIDSVGLQHQHAIRAALDAALGTGEGA